MAFLEDGLVAAVEVEVLAATAGRLGAAACRALGAARHAEGGGPSDGPVGHRYLGREELWLWPPRERDGVRARISVSHEAHRSRCRLFERREPASSPQPPEDHS